MKKRFVFNALLLILSFYALTKVNLLFLRKGVLEKFDGYKSDDNEIIFLGTSHVGHGIEPLLLWKQTGLHAFTIRISSDGFDRQQVLLDYILDTDNPKLIVIEVDQYWDTLKTIRQRSNEEDFGKSIACFHDTLDAFPFSLAKTKAVLKWDEPLATKIEFLFPIYQYHERWKSLKEKDFGGNAFKISHARGWNFNAVCEGNNDIRETAKVLDQLPPLAEIDDAVLSSEGAQILREMIDSAHRKGAKVLLLKTPLSLNPENAARYAVIQKLADECGVRYLNLSEDLSAVDFLVGFEDHSHLNPIGSKQATEQVAKYISEHYSDICSIPKEIRDKRDQQFKDEYKHWIEDYSEELDGLEELNDLLIMAYQEDYEVTICIDHPDALPELTKKIMTYYGLSENSDSSSPLWLNRKTGLSNTGDTDVDVWVWSRSLQKYVCEKSFDLD